MKKNVNSTKNLHEDNNKSLDLITKIINNISYIKKEIQASTNIKRPKANYQNYRANIHLFQNYESYKKESRTINIDYTITRPNFFINKNTINIKNIKKNNYYKAKTIDFNSNYHLKQVPNSSKINYKSKKKIVNHLNHEEYDKKSNDIDDILYFNYNNKKLNQIYKKNFRNYNYIFRNEIPPYKNRLGKNYNSINVVRRNNDFNKRKFISQREKIFLNDILKIYNKYNENKKGNYQYDYEKIILWIKDLINKKEISQIKNNEYEDFCKQLMVENNINDFSSFQNFVKDNIKFL